MYTRDSSPQNHRLDVVIAFIKMNPFATTTLLSSVDPSL